MTKDQTADEKELLSFKMPKINLTIRERLLFYGGVSSGSLITIFYTVNHLSIGLFGSIHSIIVSSFLFILLLILFQRFNDVIDYLKKNEN